MDVQKLYNDYNIYIAGPGDKHWRYGWLNTACPCCTGKSGNHMGFCQDPTSRFYDAFICFRCGGHNNKEVISKLLKVSEDQASSIILKYGGKTKSSLQIYLPRPVTPKARSIDLPPRTMPLKGVSGALRYVLKRGFDPDELINVWGVQATGPMSILFWKDRTGKERKLDLSYRIVVPITHNDKLVSWQCRDWTGKANLKYLTCPPELEVEFHKSLLYGIDQAEGMDEATLVEGVWDVWRVGKGSVGSFGIKYRPKQIMMLSQFPRVNLLYDPEPTAQLQALKIMRELRQFGTMLRRVNTRTGKDPAESSRERIKEMLCSGC